MNNRSTRIAAALGAALFLTCGTHPAAADAGACAARDGGLGIERIVEIDTSGGPLYGDITKQVKEDSFLKPREVVLTFDDGPMPWVTGPILDTLDRFCTKATFFSVGRMAVAYPQTLRDIVARGHTLGSHTWSHPLNLKRIGLEKAMYEIERGLAAVTLASGGAAAPFFRFPGLSDNAAMLDALQKRGVAAFTVDVVTNDSYMSSPDKVVSTTLARLEERQRGIILFHDIKPATAKALPTILTELKKRGYKVVHMRAKTPARPLEVHAAELQPLLAKKDPPRGAAVAKAAMLPFFGAAGPERAGTAAASPPEATATGKTTASENAEVVTLSPPPRTREARPEATTSRTASAEPTGSPVRTLVPRRRTSGAADAVSVRAGATSADGWSTRVRRQRLNRTYFD